ncbi:thiolase family protein, partial [Acinetobacter baumannii]|nr:thiolase family protein [Acinetobacter baumannii]
MPAFKVSDAINTAFIAEPQSLSSLTAPELGAAVIRESIQRAGVKP